MDNRTWVPGVWAVCAGVLQEAFAHLRRGGVCLHPPGWVARWPVAALGVPLMQEGGELDSLSRHSEARHDIGWRRPQAHNEEEAFAQKVEKRNFIYFHNLTR